MGTDFSSSSVTFPGQTNYDGVAGYVPNNAGTGYVLNSDGTGYVPNNAGTGYVLNSDGTGYVPQSGGTGYMTSGGTGGYYQNAAGASGYVPQNYGGGGTSSLSGVGGYVSPGSYVTPQSQQRFFPRRVTYLDQTKFFGLHPRLAIGTKVMVTNPDIIPERSVVVEIVGRPKDLAVGRCLTLTQAAFQMLADLSDGVTHCIVSPVPPT